ncbi:hypothetical protein BN1110_03068 [bacterium YEK0313]|nr:hypothetical protein BN1110_03068 [bacterium YEK0313]
MKTSHGINRFIVAMMPARDGGSYQAPPLRLESDDLEFRHRMLLPLAAAR